MKVLFDANTPAPLAYFLQGHEVVRADQLGRQGLENGALLDAAEQAGFDLLLTCDQNVRYQQNFKIRNQQSFKSRISRRCRPPKLTGWQLPELEE